MIKYNTAKYKGYPIGELIDLCLKVSDWFIENQESINDNDMMIEDIQDTVSIVFSCSMILDHIHGEKGYRYDLVVYLRKIFVEK